MKLKATSSRNAGAVDPAFLEVKVMKARDRGLKVVQGSGGQDIDRSAIRRSQIIAAVIGLVMLAGGGARWAQLDEGSAKKAVVPAVPEAQAETAATEYFPAQYVNQAKEPEEHIQAF